MLSFNCMAFFLKEIDMQQVLESTQSLSGMEIAWAVWQQLTLTAF